MKNLKLISAFLIPALALPAITALTARQTRASTRVIFSDNLDDGDISDWTITLNGSGVFEPTTTKSVSAPYSLHMNAPGNSQAMGVSPSYTYDANLAQNYHVSFSFLIPGTTNHWFEVFNNHQIYLIIDLGDDLKSYDGSASYLIDELSTDQWYLVEIKAHPAFNTYDVYLNSQFKRTCTMWEHTGLENTFRIGDRENGSSDYGQAYWDNFQITQPVDSDADGIVDPNDNCPYDYNPSQTDRNADDWGDLCECIAADTDDVNLIDFLDFSTIASDWRQTGSALTGDINADQTVDFNDLEILAFHWLSDCPQE